MSKPNARSVGGEELSKLVRQDKGSPIVLARLAWVGADSFRKYVASIADKQRVFPSMLPTQATGRWRISEPPVINFPDDAKAEKKGLPKLRKCFIPDPGTYWLCCDYEAQHARFMAMGSNDLEDIQAFRDDLDVHTITACRVFKWPLPPNLRDPHLSPECLPWRTELAWLGKGDRRRHLMKTIRYALLNAYDEKGVLESKDVEDLGLTMVEVLNHARAYLKAKPNMVAFKKSYCDAAIAESMARSVYGRRRILRGPGRPPLPGEKPSQAYKLKFKAAISQWLQGTETDILERSIVGVTDAFPECHLVYPSHDGMKFSFPDTITVEEALDTCKPIVEQEVTIGQHTLPMTATWEIVTPDGQVVGL